METDSISSRTLAPHSPEVPRDHLPSAGSGAGEPAVPDIDQAEYVFAKAEAQRSATLIQVAALAGAALCIALAALLQTPINNQRKELQLVLQSNLYKELPPKYAWVSAAGGTFRGIAADILWIRSESLKQEGKYYELHQLAKWICTLQPRFATVWSFQAWNMSYNISVATHTTRERWQWVYNGIRLLRDEGIPNNEKVVGLYHQLAWTYFHKVGERLDDYQLKYKRIWATTMETLLGTPPAGLSDQEAVDWFKPVVEAPHTLEELFAKHPGTKALVEKLAAIGVDVEVGTKAINVFHPLEVNFFKPYTAWSIERSVERFRKTAKEPPAAYRDLWAFLDAAPAEDLGHLLAYLRSKVLREQYKMDPQFMYDMSSKLGPEQAIPIDWRTPWAHSMYWGMYGTEKARDVKNVEEFDLLNTDRIVLFSLGALARQGDYIFRPNLETPEESFLNMRPDWRYVEAVHQKALELGKKYDDEDDKDKKKKKNTEAATAGEAFKDYHINTLHSLLLGLYFSGRTEQAQKYYDYLVVNYPDQWTGKTKEIYTKGTFRDFIQKQIEEMAGSRHEATMLIHSLLENAYIELANGRHDEYTRRANQAFQLYTSYQKDKADDPQGRRGLEPWDQMLADALGGVVTSPELPLAMRFMVWDRESNVKVKQRCYDDVRRVLEEMYGETDLDIDKAFPEPPGMAEFRAKRPAMTPEDVARQALEEKKKREGR